VVDDVRAVRVSGLDDRTSLKRIGGTWRQTGDRTWI
jgi:hypothetical protein